MTPELKQELTPELKQEQKEQEQELELELEPKQKLQPMLKQEEACTSHKKLSNCDKLYQTWDDYLDLEANIFSPAPSTLVAFPVAH